MSHDQSRKRPGTISGMKRRNRKRDHRNAQLVRNTQKMIKKNKEHKTETRVYLLETDAGLGMASTLLVTAKLYNQLKRFRILLIHPFETEQFLGGIKEKLDKIRVYFTNHSFKMFMLGLPSWSNG